MPKNTPLGIYIAGCSFLVGFGLIWHMLWLVPLGIAGAILLVVIRSFDYETEYVVPKALVEKIEKVRHSSY